MKLIKVDITPPGINEEALRAISASFIGKTYSNGVVNGTITSVNVMNGRMIAEIKTATSVILG